MSLGGIAVTLSDPGDAYVDHPSFGMAIVGRFLRGAGLSVISQPDWRNRA